MSDCSFEVAHQWIADCDNGRGSHRPVHKASGSPGTPIMPGHPIPFRLIDLAPKDSSAGRFVLQETCAANFEHDVYCTLSYCWGEHLNPYWITTKENLQDRMAGFDPADLPNMLRDATAIARRLGIQSQLIWECAHADEYEDRLLRVEDLKLHEEAVRYELRPPFNTFFHSRLITHRTWYDQLIENYSKRKLTHGNDKLAAIAALAASMNMKLNSSCRDYEDYQDYVAGIWRKSLIYGLGWRRIGPGKKSPNYRCPSWSWAS
ncbi:hypothetical protein F5Y09DRAFT_352147 [Xylaria sp. FL1042]|nr:hypothetical protein F5Y09DRAFT_352147 [Xylaria sp. FL1042]